MYNRVVKNNQITYGIPFQLKIPVNLHNIKFQDEIEEASNEAAAASDTDLAEETIAKAREEADMITKEAGYEASKIVEEAEKEAKARAGAIEEEARQKGYAEGINNARQEYEARLQEAENIRNNASEEHDHIIACMEAEIVELTIEIAKKVIGSEFEANKESILSVAKQAIEKCSNRDDMIIKVSKDDYEYLNENIEKLLSEVQGVGKVDIRQDLSLKQGDCIVDTPFGSVDAGVQTRLAKVEEAFRKLMGERLSYSKE